MGACFLLKFAFGECIINEWKHGKEDEYVVARKAPKVYMDNLLTTEVDSITTNFIQNLCIGQRRPGLPQETSGI